MTTVKVRMRSEYSQDCRVREASDGAMTREYHRIVLPAWRRGRDVPQNEVSEKQILDSLERLSPEGRREAVQPLLAGLFPSVCDQPRDIGLG
jgi:hypothetical protein